MKNHTEIICVVDRSGSMKKIKDDAIGGFNSFLASQKEVPGSASLTLVLFDNHYDLIHNNVPIQDVKELDDKTYVPRGTTALFNAIGKTIDDIGIRLANTTEDERPNKILFIILTDGDENASRFYDQEKINHMISHQTEKYNWA